MSTVANEGPKVQSILCDGKVYTAQLWSDGLWRVGSLDADIRYVVAAGKYTGTCDCPAAKYGQGDCKHVIGMRNAGIIGTPPQSSKAKVPATLADRIQREAARYRAIGQDDACELIADALYELARDVAFCRAETAVDFRDRMEARDPSFPMNAGLTAGSGSAIKAPWEE